MTLVDKRGNTLTVQRHVLVEGYFIACVSATKALRKRLNVVTVLSHGCRFPGWIPTAKTAF